MNDVAIVYSDYYKEISDGLITGIETYLDPKFSIHKFNVKGSWEIIYKINDLIDSKNFSKFIAVGVICKGDTDHYEFISQGVIDGMINTTVNKNVYISNCVLNVHNLDQAKLRITNQNNKGKESAEALNNLFS